MTTYEDSGFENVPPVNVIADRQRGMSRTIGDLLKWRREVDHDRTSFELQINEISASLRFIKRVAVSILVTAVTGSVSVTIAILLSTGKHP